MIWVAQSSGQRRVIVEKVTDLWFKLKNPDCSDQLNDSFYINSLSQDGGSCVIQRHCRLYYANEIWLGADFVCLFNYIVFQLKLKIGNSSGKLEHLNVFQQNYTKKYGSDTVDLFQRRSGHI